MTGRGPIPPGFIESVPRRLGFRTAGFCGVPLEKALETVAKAGYAQVEFCMEHPEAVSYRGDMSGLKVASVSYHGKKDDARTRGKMIRAAVDKACELEAATIVLGSPLMFLCSRWSFFEECCGVMRILPEGVGPAWEPEPGTVLNDLVVFGELASHLGPEAGLNLDFGHAFLEGLSPSDAVRSHGSRIVHAHIEDMVSGVHEHLIPGRGDLPWKDLLHAIAGVGYWGPLVVDLFLLPSDHLLYLTTSHAGILRELGVT